jgi:hypothetical protein
MFLSIPTAGQSPGPDFALLINTDMSIIDSHDHTPGKGVQITPTGLNINDTLVFNDNFADQVAGITFYPQGSTPTATGTVYESANDLYFVDGLGNNIRLTQNGSVAGSTGSISGLVSPASASYVSATSTFVWESNTSIAANMDFGAMTLRNLSPNSTYGVTIQPPAALGSNYTLTLPSLPAAQSFMTLSAAGAIAAPWTVDNTTIKIVANELVAQYAPLSPQREHAWELNGPYGNSNLTFPLTNIDAIFIAPANIVITSVWIYNGTSGSSSFTEYDLKVKSPGGSYASILSTTGAIGFGAANDIYTDSGSVVGAQTGVTKPVLSTTNISAGQAIRFDILTSQGGAAADARIRIFYTLA